jgi:hypothetical protein
MRTHTGDPVGCKDPCDLAKRVGLVRIREHHLANEPSKASGLKGERLGSGLYHGESLLRANRERLAVKIDAHGPAAFPHNLLELGAPAAAHIQYAGSGGEIREAIVVKDVSGPKWFWRCHHR